MTKKKQISTKEKTQQDETEEKVPFTDPQNLKKYAMQFGNGVFEGVTGFAMLVAWIVAFGFDGLRELFPKKDKDSKSQTKKSKKPRVKSNG